MRAQNDTNHDDNKEDEESTQTYQSPSGKHQKGNKGSLINHLKCEVFSRFAVSPL